MSTDNSVSNLRLCQNFPMLMFFILACLLNASIGGKDEEGGSVTTGVSDGGAMMGNRNVAMDGVWIIFLKRWGSERFYAKKDFLVEKFSNL